MTSILKVDEIQNTDGKTGIVITPDGSLESVKFPETTGGDPNRVITSTTMSSYEEGTWAPVMASNGFNQSVGTLAGRYWKIGSVVHVNARITFVGPAYAFSHGQITGLPFASYETVASASFSSGAWTFNCRGGPAIASGSSIYYFPADNDLTTAAWDFAAVYQTDE